MGEVALPKRSRRFGIGKEIAGAVYIHRAYQAMLGDCVLLALARVPTEFNYTIVKYGFRSGAVSFVFSPDFDTSPEPVVSDHWSVSLNAPARFRRALKDPYIYHHKWLMVSEDYEGFDVRESRERSRRWLALPGIDLSRIGRQSFWAEHVLARLDACEGQVRSPHTDQT